VSGEDYDDVSTSGILRVNFPDASLGCLEGVNLIEDKGREIDPKFRRFIEIPGGSPVEPDGLLLVAKDLGYLHESEYAKLNSNLAEVERMLISLRGSARIASAAN